MSRPKVASLNDVIFSVDTIRRAGHISLDEINVRWLKNFALNPDHEPEIPERTFHRHREAIIDLFDIEIACDRATNTYYIKDAEVIDKSSFSSWLFNDLALDNQLMGNEAVKKSIVYEDTPGGTAHIPTIVEAISSNQVLSMSYGSYNKDENTIWEIEPNDIQNSSI